ncbi:OsmC family protein [Glaciibacter psychrotolerans]|uniref:Organic hydroperoxide reductase OsmC/OhrA n=1 Tax=Glaciibacter psychrotolerans TaxID=670054 RepID=A0A7Z0J658_9MICO|nr:OsmC family protein [Leifsonia psychrotolerans]NYJ20045.1 organic hydroperoxide reductase OsmC/OhrA [Leifsonia psychrotolerans]
MNLSHHYAVLVTWTGNRGSGTSHYREYGRENRVEAAGKPAIEGSADPTFHGNRELWNPEELLLAALSQCHMLSYLHVAVKNGVTVVDYTDAAVGIMEQTSDGGGHFTSATLHPRVTITDATQIDLAQSLHAEASRLCFIASSVNFPVGHEPQTVAGAGREGPVV